MSNLCEELELKFSNIETNIEKKKNEVNKSYEKNIELIKQKFDKNYLSERYKCDLNNHRDGLLKQKEDNLQLEINLVNEKDIKIYEIKIYFNRYDSIRKSILQEFKKIRYERSK